mmetsp:Transcript_49403/g.131098  ORF Transcript_49403/g.131098 Transcript_49403/m.131098 type:complete len:108 (+) Transcript_49403:46-369(+)
MSVTNPSNVQTKNLKVHAWRCDSRAHLHEESAAHVWGLNQLRTFYRATRLSVGMMSISLPMKAAKCSTSHLLWPPAICAHSASKFFCHTARSGPSGKNAAITSFLVM